MFEDRTDQAAVKLTDFGLAGLFVEGGPPLTEVLGSAYYVAPEVLRWAAHG
jgi:serine/threonine protein kinase